MTRITGALHKDGSSKWPRRLRRGFAAARLLGLRVWIPPTTWMSVSCECYVLSGSYLCIGLITRPEEPYRVWCVWEWWSGLDNEEALTHGQLLYHGKHWRPEFCLEWEMFQTKVVDKIKTHILCSITLFSKIMPFVRYVPHITSQIRSD